MQAFCDRFVPDGFRPESLQTCYAMAETVFAVSTSDAHCRPRLRRIYRGAWQTEHRAVAVNDPLPMEPIGGGAEAIRSTSEAIVHVSNGRCVPDCEVRIVDNDGQPLPRCSAGRVLVRSSFLFSGYFRRDDLNTGLFTDDGFFDTGDIGYLDEESHVYITGRRKDLVIVGGKNIYPQDVEESAAGVPGVHPGRLVCFGVEQRSLATEGLVLLLESDEPESDWVQLAQRVRKAIPARLDVDLLDVRVVARSTLRKSTSGKLAREGNRQWYLEGRFGAVPPGIAGGE
jgi:acyl-CoA synthetase (AMP-forming)/AMP-acid ligase II